MGSLFQNLRFAACSLAGVCLLTVAACATAASQQERTPASAPPSAATAQPQEPSNPNQEINDRYVQQIAERIADRQNEPAEQVFQNIQLLKGVPAGRLLLIMNRGYSRALGVSCTHCHVEHNFASDDKRPKRAAREMAVMHRMINEQLRKMENLETPSDERAINCSTCHRGAVDPMAAEQ